MKNLFNKIQTLFFPYLCCLCEGYSGRNQDLCEYCYPKLPWIEDRCYRCGLKLLKKDEAIFCEKCTESPPTFERLCAVFGYEPPIIQMVTGLKFGSQLAYGRVLGEIFAEKVYKWYQNDHLPEAVLPVPLHKKRLRQRGYNQSLELLQPFIKQSKIPLLLQSCERVRATKPQSGLCVENRRQNIQKSFVLKRAILQKHIAVMDDVVTTGSTINALCDVLKESVDRIDIWCICRV